MRMLIVLALWFGTVSASAQELAGDSDRLSREPDGTMPSGSPEPLADGATIVEVYDGSVATLEKVCDDYRRIKALELAKIRDIAFLDAYKHVQSVMPVLQPINRELLRKPITDPNEIQTHKREVERVEGEVANMVELVARLLLEIEVVQQQMTQVEPVNDEDDATTLEEIVEQPQYDPEKEETVDKKSKPSSPEMKELITKATENPVQPAVDITKEMQALMPPPSPPSGSTPQQTTNGSGEKTIRAEIKDPDLSSDVGRRIVTEGGSPVEWMYIDTWYTIGPFPNPQRINLNTKFPPETVVNLSAVYPGKDNRAVRWEFLQTNRLKCIPHHDEEYAIYYAYTEIHLDRPMALWVAIGSDDKADVWVNGLPIWISGAQLKSRRWDEGLRKVQFRQGVNRILYRVENGWKGTSFSMAIQVKL